MSQIVEQLILPEDKEKGEVNFGIIKTFIKHGGGIIIFIIMVVLMETISVALRIFASLMMQRWC